MSYKDELQAVKEEVAEWPEWKREGNASDRMPCYQAWTHVNERLPGHGEWVIATMVTDEGVLVRPCKHDGRGVFRVGTHYPLVTHWMALPMPPAG